MFLVWVMNGEGILLGLCFYKSKLNNLMGILKMWIFSIKGGVYWVVFLILFL